jgi:alpha-tubulin suppressor-like RCC1 family protein
MQTTRDANRAWVRFGRWGCLATLLGLFSVLGCGGGHPAKVEVLVINAHGGFHTCAVFSNGSVKCWGQGTVGQLGNGTIGNSSTPVTVSGLVGAIAVAAGEQHTCAILSNGTVKCWGDNAYGELGDGTTTDSSTPVTVTGVSGAIVVAAGSGFTCVLLSGGSVQCWGGNDWGQLGSATTATDRFGDGTCSLTPVSVAGISGATGIGVGSAHTCVVVAGGAVQCWGANYEGQLGDGIYGTETGSIATGSPTPMTVVGSISATAITADNVNTCALVSDGTVQCWGSDMDDALGAHVGSSSTPVAVQGVSGATALAGGGAMCVLASGGAVQCWGRNDHGQLGDGNATSSSTPLTVAGLSGATSLASGGRHTCALLSDHTVKCWGDNVVGELGDGMPLDYTTRAPALPETVVGL